MTLYSPKMPPSFKTINIADLILVWSLQNYFLKFPINAGQWRDSTDQIFSALKLRYLSSVANHQARKVIDNNIALV